MVRSAASRRPASSVQGSAGGSSAAFWGRKESSSRTAFSVASSVSKAKWATPERVAWARAPPSSSFGDLLVRHRADRLRPVQEHGGGALHHEDEVGDGRAVDRAAGAGAEDDRDLRAPRRRRACCAGRCRRSRPAPPPPPGCGRRPSRAGRRPGSPPAGPGPSPCRSSRRRRRETEPPKTVKSWAKTKTCRPSTRPWPMTTPSPGIFWRSIPKSALRWVLNLSSSTKVPGSRKRSMRSRAVSLPASCCRATRSSPPPRSAAWFIESSSARRGSGSTGFAMGGEDSEARG